MSRERHRPHILIIYPDQMRADAMGCAGNRRIGTPNMDRLAREGLRFDHAYSAFPLCCPWRASLMTGRYPHSHGLCANHYPVPLGQTFLAELFRGHGYRTGYVGKWHLNGGRKHDFVPSGEARLGFESFAGFSRGHRYFDSVYYRDDDPRPRTSSRYEPDYQTDQLIDFMKAGLSDPAERPFFGMICYGPPHPPLVAPEEYLTRYTPEAVEPRANVPEDPETRRRAGEFLGRYYGLVSAVDDNVGKILDWLEDAGLDDDTVVILVSDHGEMAWEHGRMGKKTYYEASMRVPFLLRYPRRFQGGRVVDTLVDPSVDIMPTLLELCGIPTPEDVEGTSFLPVIAGEREAVRNAIFYEICMEREGPEAFPVPERGVRTKEWLYVRTRDAASVLFDLKADPLEMVNLVESRPHRGIMEELDRMLYAHMEATSDDWSIEAVFPPEDFQTHREGAAFAEEVARRAIRDG